MARYRFAALSAALGLMSTSFNNNCNELFALGFTAPRPQSRFRQHNKSPLFMSTTERPSESAPVDYNAVFVAKEGGMGVKSASEMMGMKGNTRSLGAPPPRPPRGGTFVTEGGVTIDANVRPLRYTHGDIDECPADDCDDYVSSFFEDGGEESGLKWGSDGAIERLIDLLDHKRGALLTSSYEFPGR